MGKTYKQFFFNFNALKTHFILNTYALVNHGIKFYQFQSLPNLHLYKTLNLEEMTLRFQAEVFPVPRNHREKQNSTQLNVQCVDHPTIILISKLKLNKPANCDSSCKQDVPNM